MLSLGKIRGLDTLASERGTFAMLALDHRGSFAGLVAKAKGGSATWEDVVGEKERLGRNLLPLSTAVLLDPLYASGPLLSRGVLPGRMGFLVALEKSGHEEGPNGRRNTLEPGWTAEAIKRMGAAGVKLLVQYHPDAGTAAAQEEFVAEVAAECAAHDLVLVLEPVTYNPKGAKEDPAFQATMPGVIEAIARRFDALGGVDLLKLDFPAPAASSEAEMTDACAAVTAATALPWVVLSGGVDFDSFLVQTRAACAGGASGFLAGRAIWKEAMAMADPAARDSFLQRDAVPRMAALRAVAEAAATPWRARPGAGVAPLAEGWQLAYAARP